MSPTRRTVVRKVTADGGAPRRRAVPRDAAAAPAGDDAALVRSEEELRVGKVVQETGRVRARKVVDTVAEERLVPRGTEYADVERVAPAKGDSGQIETLPDGSVSIPVFEEQLVIEKRLVVRERIIIRKHTVTEDHVVEADLRRERVVVDADPEVESRVAAPGATRTRRKKAADAAPAAKRTRRTTRS